MREAMVSAASVENNVRNIHVIFKLLSLLDWNGYLWPRHAHVSAGGGKNGCILASKLSQLNVSVLLIEAGDTPRFETQLPGQVAYLTGTEYDWDFTFNDSYSAASSQKLHQGKVLGGSSQIGYTFYGVGDPKYYDEWAKIVNDSSWNFESVLPLFKRNEKVIDKVILNSCDRIYHGTKGNIKLKKYYSDLNTCYFKSYKKAGYNVVKDIKPKNILGYTNMFFTFGEGTRQSTAYKFLSPEKNNPNLHVLYNSLITKIVFDKSYRAVGLEILTKEKKEIIVNGRKEIIISGGVIKTPQLLMLSGIGPKSHLEEKRIKVVSDVPVGEKLREPTITVLVYKMGKRKILGKPNPNEFVSPIIHGYVAVNKSQNYADYETISGVLEDSEIFLLICRVVYSLRYDVCDRLNKATLGRERYYLAHSLLNPKSYGKILLNSTNPEDQPIIHLGCYSNKKNLENHAKYVKDYNEILNTSYYKSVNAELADPEFDACKYIKRGSQAYWKCYVRGMTSTLHNLVGTCAMGSVVDSRLCVKGVKGLRVVDASIIPLTVGATVQATVMMIAQKALDMIKQDHNLTD